MSWAEKLEGPKPDGNGGDGDGGSGGGEEKDFEFMLKVMRMVQAEQDIPWPHSLPRTDASIDETFRKISPTH